jgi:3-dehydroquinate synthase
MVDTSSTLIADLFEPRVISITSQRESTCHIHVRPGLLNQIGELLPNVPPFKGDLFIVTDNYIRSLYGDILDNSLQKHGGAHHFIEVARGEEAKTLEVASKVIDQILVKGAHRRGLLVAFGGGAITDLTGFVASIYMRGINYVNIPTTLTAQLDAGIGGKTAVDHHSVKNLIGSFFHPPSVYCDPQVLGSLPTRELKNGLAEAVKVAMISSSELFEFIEFNLESIIDKDIPSLSQLVQAAVRLKVRLLEKDPYEKNLRRSLNFGHSVAHTIEAAKGFSGINHGEAVAIGMACASRIAQKRRLCSKRTIKRLLTLLERAELPTGINDISVEEITKFLEPIKLIRGGSLHFVLPTGIGKVTIRDDISDEEIALAITAQ